jgi:acetaldehyde dehydrogenase (acetylating)
LKHALRQRLDMMSVSEPSQYQCVGIAFVVFQGVRGAASSLAIKAARLAISVSCSYNVREDRPIGLRPELEASKLRRHCPFRATFFF